MKSVYFLDPSGAVLPVLLLLLFDIALLGLHSLNPVEEAKFFKGFQ
jgi:hypothetical protein